MFTTLKYRRHIAVLAALAMVASVLVAAPTVADEHPEQDYPATFDACVGVPASDFEDVPMNHANAGDIDCIAYYGITKGTSATTYSPLMSVTREHMALFLTRLAGTVGIEVASDPADAGFTDIGDLSENSQMAINQLADLGVARGTSATTYSPQSSVTRGQMALFISRLMNLMDPMADGDTMYGYTPEDVVDVEDDEDTPADESKTVDSPFTDLGSATVTAYNAIRALWELGVASGISDTAYGPSALITRASMAEFMAGVLDHSNARPAGVSIQATKTWDFGGFDPTIAVSYRDDNFMPMVDVSIKTFNSAAVGEFNEDGGCTDATMCAWTDDELLTDGSGNIFEGGTVENGEMNTYYAWMGDADADENDFDVNTSPHATVTLSSTTDAVKLKVTTDISENSTGGNTVDIDSGDSVTLTAQLVDGDGEPVAKAGVEVLIGVQQNTAGPAGGTTVTLYPPPAPMETDDDGMVTYTTSGPKSTKGNTDNDRTDTITFSSDVNESGTIRNAVNTAETDGDPEEVVVATIVWTDSDPTLLPIAVVADQTRGANGSGKGSADPYAFLSGQNKVTVRATVSFYDQYGNPAGKGESVTIAIGTNADTASNTRTVSSRGMASWSRTLEATLGADIMATYALVVESGVTAPVVESTTVVSVRHADDDSTAATAQIDAVYDKEDRFRVTDTTDPDAPFSALYSYDDDDTFINGISGHDDVGKQITLDQFEGLIKQVTPGASGAAGSVEVVWYDDDGVSIFRVTAAGS